MRILLAVWIACWAQGALASPLEPLLGERAHRERLAAAAPGDWAEYALRVGGKGVGPWVRFLVIGPAAGGGTTIEVWISERPGSATQAYRLEVGGAPGADRRVQARLLGGERRQLVLPAGEPPVAEAAPPLEWIDRGIEPVATQAGTLRAVASEGWSGGRRIARAWIAAEVPVFGLVRLDLAGGAGLELHAWGRGGRGVVDGPAER